MGRFAGMLNANDYVGTCSICGEPKQMTVNLLGMLRTCANHTESNCPNKQAVADGKWGPEELAKRIAEIRKLALPI